MARSHEFSGPGFNITRRGPRGLRGLAHAQIAKAHNEPTPDNFHAAQEAVAAAGTSKKSRDSLSGSRDEGSGFGNALRKIQAKTHGYVFVRRSFLKVQPEKSIEPKGRSPQPALVETTSEVGDGELLVDFKKSAAPPEGINSSTEITAHTLEAKRRAEQARRDEQDKKVKAFLTSSLGAIIIGEQQTLKSNVQIGKALTIHRDNIAESLLRLGMSDFVNDVRKVLSKRSQAARALEQSLAEARENPREGVASHAELARRLGMSRTVVSKAAGRQSLREPLREAREEARRMDFIPSQQSARLLGMLIGAGSVETRYGIPTRIIFSSKRRAHHTDETTPALDAFERAGEKIFGTRGQRKRRHTSTVAVAFNNTQYAGLLGKITREEAYKIRRKRDWLISPTYIESFASGIFDARGILYVNDTRARLYFYTSSENTAKVYREVLIALGIHGALLEREGETEKVKCVKITNLKDLKLYASHIHSVIPTEQEKLNKIKEM